MGKWVPVFKKEDRSERGNYRPITILIVIDKIFESLLAQQIAEHYDSILYYKMTAYRRDHSCEYTLLNWTNRGLETG